ncbi:hypothetical protein Lal_00000807, partial [Lupinus albus]
QSTYPNRQDHYKSDQINEYVLRLILVIYVQLKVMKKIARLDSIDILDANESQTFNILIIEFLNPLTIYALPNNKIKLKVITSIRLLRNLDQHE